MGDVIESDIGSHKSLCRRVKPFFGHVILFVGVLLYTGIGALIFQRLEGPPEIERTTRLKQLLLNGRTNFSQTVMAKTLQGDDLSSSLSLALEQYDILIDQVTSEGISVLGGDELKSDWTYIRSFFFASTVLTTIGYGNMTPKTREGRAFCIFFALLGIHLTVTALADLGKLIASVMSYFYKSCRPTVTTKDVTKSSSKLRKFFGHSTIATAVVGFLFLYISAGGYLFSYLENWDFFDSFYFCFITMSTIGFGDLVPGQLTYLILCSIYLLVGLALCFTAFELVRSQYADSWKKMQQHLHELSAPLEESLKRCGDNVHNERVLKELLDIKKALAVRSERIMHETDGVLRASFKHGVERNSVGPRVD